MILKEDNMKDIVVELSNVTFSYDEPNNAQRPAVHNISLTVHRGEYVAVLGHNGSGKSTLAKLINLNLDPTYGKIELFGIDTTSDNFSYDDMWEMRRRVGMVFQNPDNQLVATVVEEDVAFGPENLALEREEIIRRVHSALAMVSMTEYARHAPHKLSGGQKQRVAIAGVIAMRPDLIIFDESTAMLDPQGRRDVVEIMEKLNREEGITVINITHYMEEAARAERVIVMDDGSIAMDGTPKEVFSHVEILREMGLEVPQGTEICYELSKRHHPIRLDVITPDECVEALLEVLGGASK